MANPDELRTAMIRANPALSRYRPLPMILAFDEFDRGYCGWTELTGNYKGRLGVSGSMYGYLQFDMRPPMLSTLSMWDTGTVGSVDGGYTLKLATRAEKEHMAQSIKRLTLGGPGLLQWEAYFTFKTEATVLEMSAGTEAHYRDLGINPPDDDAASAELRAFGLCYDLQDNEERYWPGVRYLNVENGVPRETWQYHAGGVRHPNLDGWVDLEDGAQELCYNELPTKQNWHYLRWLIDVETREYVELQCNDRTFDMRGKRHRYRNVHPNEQYEGNMPSDRPALPHLTNMLNACTWVEADGDRRSFLYFDSMVLSADW